MDMRTSVQFLGIFTNLHPSNKHGHKKTKEGMGKRSLPALPGISIFATCYLLDPMIYFAADGVGATCESEKLPPKGVSDCCGPDC